MKIKLKFDNNTFKRSNDSTFDLIHTDTRIGSIIYRSGTVKDFVKLNRLTENYINDLIDVLEYEAL